ncbi:hypothetical protein [Burkholderia pyrrocinia]
MKVSRESSPTVPVNDPAAQVAPGAHVQSAGSAATQQFPGLPLKRKAGSSSPSGETEGRRTRAKVPERRPILDAQAQETHDNIATGLAPQDLISLADTNRALRRAYAPHVEWARLKSLVIQDDEDNWSPLFQRQFGYATTAESDEALIVKQLTSFLNPTVTPENTTAPNFRNMPVWDKAECLVGIVHQARGGFAGSTLRQEVLALVRPHVQELPAHPREHVIDGIATGRKGRPIPSDAPWCLDLIEVTGVTAGTAQTLMMLGQVIGSRDLGTEQSSSIFSRVLRLAGQLDQGADAPGHGIRMLLATKYLATTDCVATAKALIDADAASGGPEDKRVALYCEIAKAAGQDQVTAEQRASIKMAIEQAASSLSPPALEELTAKLRLT